MQLAAFTTAIALDTTRNRQREMNFYFAEIPARDDARVADTSLCVVLEAGVKKKELLKNIKV